MLPVPLRRDRFTTEVGPDDSGSKPGIEGCNHLPEISGIDAPLSLPLLADPTVGAADCAKTGVATTAASNTAAKFRHCKSIALLLVSSRCAGSSRIKPAPARREGGAARCPHLAHGVHHGRRPARPL